MSGRNQRRRLRHPAAETSALTWRRGDRPSVRRRLVSSMRSRLATLLDAVRRTEVAYTADVAAVPSLAALASVAAVEHVPGSVIPQRLADIPRDLAPGVQAAHQLACWTAARPMCRRVVGDDPAGLLSSSLMWAIAVLPGDRLAAASTDGSVRVWCMRTSLLLARLCGCNAARAVCPLPGDHLATAGVDAVVRIWALADATTDAPLDSYAARLELHHAQATVNVLVFEPRLSILVVGGLDRSIQIYHVAASRTCARVTLLARHVFARVDGIWRLAVATLPRRDTLLVVAASASPGTMVEASLFPAQLLAKPVGRPAAEWTRSQVHSASAAAGEGEGDVNRQEEDLPTAVALVASVDARGADGCHLVSSYVHDNHETIGDVCIVPEAERIVVASARFTAASKLTVYSYDLKVMRCMVNDRDAINEVAVVPGTPLLVTGSESGTINILDTITWDCLASHQVSERVFSLAVMPSRPGRCCDLVALADSRRGRAQCILCLTFHVEPEDWTAMAPTRPVTRALNQARRQRHQLNSLN